MGLEEFCRGKLKDGDCDCEEYSAPLNPEPNRPQLCTECLHGKSKHPVQAAKQLSSAPILPSSSDPPSKQSVLDIFSKRVAEGVPSTTVSTTSSKSPPSKVSFGEARADALDGFRPDQTGSASAAPISKKKKGKTKVSLSAKSDWNFYSCVSYLK
jgi:hypothetical protein